MTSTVRDRLGPPPTQASGRVAAAPGGPRLRRRWGRIGAGAAAAVVGAWVFAAMYVSAGDRTDVLVAASDLDRFERIERSDLRVVRISVDDDIEWIAAQRLDEFIGRLVAVDVVGGSLLAPSQMLPSDHQVVSSEEAVVGLLLGPGDGPTRALRRGTPVAVVVRSPAGSTATVASVPGWVLDSSGEASTGRERPVEVVVSRDDAAGVSAAAADQRVSIVAFAN